MVSAIIVIAKHGILGMLAIYLVAGAKYLTEAKYERKVCSRVPGATVYCGKIWPAIGAGGIVTWHQLSGSREMHAAAQPTFSFLLSPEPHGMVPPIFRMSLPTSINLDYTQISAHPDICF